MKKISTGDDIRSAVGAPTLHQMAVIAHMRGSLQGQLSRDGAPYRFYASYPEASDAAVLNGKLYGMPVVRGPLGVLVTDGLES